MPVPTQLVIVLIEDDEGHARLIQKNLRRAGVENKIETFTTGSSALDYLMGEDEAGSDATPLAVLLDLGLPDMHGGHVLRTLRENKKMKPTPVYVLSATDDRYEVDRCYSLGCTSYVVKPVSYDAFSETIQDLGQQLKKIESPN